jgi:glycosyltransferase involved in cell wall biosynthesis
MLLTLKTSMKPNRILLIGSSPDVGLTFYYTRLATVFKRSGIDVVVLSEEREQYPYLHEELKSCDIKRYTSKFLHKSVPTSLINVAKYIVDIFKRDGPFDVILGGGVREGSKILFSKKYIDSNPISISIVGSLPRRKAEQFIASRSYNWFYDKNVVLCNFTKGQLTRLGVKDSKIIVSPLFAPDLEWFDKARRSKVDLELYNLEKVKHPVVFYAAGHYPHKGFEYYLMAAAEVLKSADVIFVLGGRGPLTESLKKLSEKLGISRHVIFTGWISIYHMPYILSNIPDICVSTSLVEQLPSYVMECMAAKKPIVASSIGGVPEIVLNGVNGYLVSPRDYKETARRIMELLNEPEKAKEMGQAGRKVIEQKLNMKASISKLMKIYEKLCET